MRNFFYRNLRIIILAAAFALPALHGHARQQDTDSLSVIMSDTTTEDEFSDTATVQPDDSEDTKAGAVIVPVSRSMMPDSIRKIKNQPGFAWLVYLDSTLRARQKEKDRRPPEREEIPVETPSVWDAGIVKAICYLVAIGLVGFVLFKLFIRQGIFFSSRRQVMPMVVVDEELNESDLEKALRRATEKKDYRLAVRYLFLITLNRLGEKGIVQLSSQKTNYQYATELANKPYANSFAQLSLQYEYVWFGNFSISGQQFAAMQGQHQQFLKQV